MRVGVDLVCRAASLRRRPLRAAAAARCGAAAAARCAFVARRWLRGALWVVSGPGLLVLFSLLLPSRKHKHCGRARRMRRQCCAPMLRAFWGGQWQQTWLQQLCCGSNRLVNDAAPRSAKARRANRDHTPGEIVAVTGAEPESCCDTRPATQRPSGPECKTSAPALQTHASRQPLVGC